jgi:glutaminase
MSFSYEDVKQIYNNMRSVDLKGNNASYIPDLKNVDPTIFSISICNINGKVMNFGDYKKEVGIESVSKVFTLALVLKKYNIQTVLTKIGNMSEHHSFNSMSDVVHTQNHTINSFVNAGAIATTSLLYNENETKDENDKNITKNILENMENFAGRKLKINNKLYLSEYNNSEHNNKLIKKLMKYNRFYGDPETTLKVYTKQCSVMVNSNDIAIMAATLANYGKNPITKKNIISKEKSEYIITHMANHGLYNESKIWWKNTFLPTKSGVGGVIMIVIPGVMGIGIISPPLNKNGNSIKGLQTGNLLANLPIY